MNLLAGQQLSWQASAVLAQLAPYSSAIVLSIIKEMHLRCQLKGYNGVFHELYDVITGQLEDVMASVLYGDVFFLHEDSAEQFKVAREQHIKALNDCLYGRTRIHHANSLLVSRAGRLKHVSRFYYVTQWSNRHCEVVIVENQVQDNFKRSLPLHWCDETLLSAKKPRRSVQASFISCQTCGVKETIQARYVLFFSFLLVGHTC